MSVLKRKNLSSRLTLLLCSIIIHPNHDLPNMYEIEVAARHLDSKSSSGFEKIDER